MFRSDTNESISGFIEKTCKNMNVNCFNELREDMNKAWDELKYFQEKDNFLEGLKAGGLKKHQR